MGRLALVLCAVAAVIGTQSCSNIESYRNRHAGESLYKALYDNVSNGESLANVQALLGPGQHLEATDREKALKAVHAFAERYPTGYPDGALDTDEIIQYPIATAAFLNLQFRDGKLVNFVREDFRTYREVIAMASQ